MSASPGDLGASVTRRSRGFRPWYSATRPGHRGGPRCPGLGVRAARAGATAATYPSATSSAASMMSRPRTSSSSVITSGGATCRRLKCTNGQRPACLHAAATAAIGAASAPARVERHERLAASRRRARARSPRTARARAPRRPTDAASAIVAQARLDDARAEVAHALEDAVALEHLERRDARGAGERMARVREAALERDGVEVRGDPLRDHDAAERHVARVHALREGDEVGHDAEVVHREPLADAAEAHHDLVGDVDDAVPVAELAHALQVARRRHEHAVGADDRLEDDRGDRAGALERDDLLEVGERALRPPARAMSAWNDERYGYGPEEVRDRSVGRLVRPAARVARERDRRGGAAVVAAVHREHLAPAGHGARHAHGVLVGVGAAVREEHLVEVAGRDLGDAPGELAAHVVRHRRLDRREAARLLAGSRRRGRGAGARG